MQQHTVLVFLPLKTHIANTVYINFYRPFLKQYWEEKAQKHRQDLDMGVLEDMKCPACKTVLKRRKDLKYHIKDCQEYECDIPGFGKLFNQKRQGTRTSSVSNVLNVKFAANYL